MVILQNYWCKILLLQNTSIISLVPSSVLLAQPVPSQMLIICWCQSLCKILQKNVEQHTIYISLQKYYCHFSILIFLFSQ